MCKRYVRTLKLYTKFEMLIQIPSKFSLTNKKIKRQCVPHFQRLTFLSNPLSKYQILCTNTTAWVVLGDITLFFVRLFFWSYSKTYLERKCSKANTCLKRTKDFATKYQFTDQSLINIACLKRTPD